MDINSVMNTVNLNSRWSNSTSAIPIVPIVDTVTKQNTTPFVPTNIIIPTTGLNTADSSMSSQYNPLEDGTLKADVSSIISSNPSILYKAVDTLGVSQSQALGNFINALM